MAAALIVLVALCVVALLIADRAGKPGRAALCKGAASLGFVSLAATQCQGDQRFDQLVMLGLVLAALGDVLLALPGERTFLAGVGAFALGHLAYVAAAACYASPLSAPWYGLLVWLPSAAVFAWLHPHLGAMRMPVIGYVLIISVMVMGACALLQVAPRAGLPFFVGALLFYASDLSVARDRFVKEAFVNRLWGLPVYYAAQLLIALSMADL